MKRLLDVLRPRVEAQLKSWGSCIPDGSGGGGGGATAPGERLSEVTVLLRAKFRNYLQAVVEKLAENVSPPPSSLFFLPVARKTPSLLFLILLLLSACGLQSRGHNQTKMKKIIQDSRDAVMESDVRTRMQPLKDQLLATIDHLHALMEPHVFIAICRGLWDRMGQVSLSLSLYPLPSLSLSL